MYCCDYEGGVRLLFHGNLGSLANNRGNAFHFPRDCMAMFKASRIFISSRMNLSVLTVERMLEPQLLPLDKDGPTEDLVCVV